VKCKIVNKWSAQIRNQTTKKITNTLYVHIIHPPPSLLLSSISFVTYKLSNFLPYIPSFSLVLSSLHTGNTSPNFGLTPTTSLKSLLLECTQDAIHHQ